jgi:hypothetical protein
MVSTKESAVKIDEVAVPKAAVDIVPLFAETQERRKK